MVFHNISICTELLPCTTHSIYISYTKKGPRERFSKVCTYPLRNPSQGLPRGSHLWKRHHWWRCWSPHCTCHYSGEWSPWFPGQWGYPWDWRLASLECACIQNKSIPISLTVENRNMAKWERGRAVLPYGRFCKNTDLLDASCILIRECRSNSLSRVRLVLGEFCGVFTH